MIGPSSRSRLTRHTLDRFTGDTLFDRIARALCLAECVPRKELYESWEVARRVRRHFRGGRVVDLAAGHGLVGVLMLLLDDSSPSVLAIDRRRPASVSKIMEALTEQWPRLEGRSVYLERKIEPSLAELLSPDDLLVSAHACGALTDRVLDLALLARARVAVLPCCHDVGRGDLGGLSGWVPGPLAMDLTRASRLTHSGYHIRTLEIPSEITPQNRLLLGDPGQITPDAAGEPTTS